MRSIFVIILFQLPLFTLGHTNLLHTIFDIQSEYTGDNYQIIINLPVNYSQNKKKYPVVYYGDAGLILGEKVRSIVPAMIENSELDEVILVGIKHFGNYRMKRRRDFIQAHHKNKKTGEWYSNDKNYGQSLKFYQFLENELLPTIEQKYRASDSNRTFLGHSLSGLFCIYASLQDVPIFKNHIALSPSLWVNYQNIWSFERIYFAKHSSLPANIFITAGSLEIANLILFNVNDYTYHLNKRNYENLKIKKTIYQGATHISGLNRGVRDGILEMYKK